MQAGNRKKRAGKNENIFKKTLPVKKIPRINKRNRKSSENDFNYKRS